MRDISKRRLLRSEVVRSFYGYQALGQKDKLEPVDSTNEGYAKKQDEINPARTRAFLNPMLKRNNASIVLDVGCGIGAMVTELLDLGYDAYGVDLIHVGRFWSSRNLDRDRFFYMNSRHTDLPFEDASFDFAYTLGVIEHVGTTNGHSDRAHDYHKIRRQWIHELFRVVRPGGHILIGGPNRGFPFDTAHGPDSRASNFELTLSRITGVTIHKPWGENFLWSFSNLCRYLEGLPYQMEPISVTNLLYFSRVPRIFRTLVRFYVKHIPKMLLGTCFNPWMLTLVHKEK